MNIEFQANRFFANPCHHRRKEESDPILFILFLETKEMLRGWGHNHLKELSVERLYSFVKDGITGTYLYQDVLPNLDLQSKERG